MELPAELYHSLAMQLSIYVNDIQELPPFFGLVLGGVLHVLSLLAHILSPDSDLGLNVFSRNKQEQGKRLFKDERRLVGSVGKGVTPAEQMRRLASLEREAWYRGAVRRSAQQVNPSC